MTSRSGVSEQCAVKQNRVKQFRSCLAGRQLSGWQICSITKLLVVYSVSTVQNCKQQTELIK